MEPTIDVKIVRSHWLCLKIQSIAPIVFICRSYPPLVVQGKSFLEELITYRIFWNTSVMNMVTHCRDRSKVLIILGKITLDHIGSISHEDVDRMFSNSDVTDQMCLSFLEERLAYYKDRCTAFSSAISQTLAPHQSELDATSIESTANGSTRAPRPSVPSNLGGRTLISPLSKVRKKY